MNLPSTPEQVSVNTDLKSTRGTRLQGRWLAFLRLTWIILSVLALILFFVSLPDLLAQVQRLAGLASLTYARVARRKYHREFITDHSVGLAGALVGPGPGCL